MISRRLSDVWRFVLMCALLCITSLPLIASAGTPPGGSPPTSPNTGYLAPGQTTRTPDYYTTANWANSPPLAKFVDSLPGLTSGNANTLGQYITVGNPDIVSYPGSDYYEIELIEFRQRMHSDLPATTGPTTGTMTGTLQRGYVQVNKGTNKAICGGASQPACSAIHNTLNPEPVRSLGPLLVAERDRPLRIKFTNKLPIGPEGDLFIPVDTSVMGAGTGAADINGNPCNNTVEPNGCASYTQNRSAIHLHGGRTPWISDGTPHQWVVPVGENTPFKKGVSLQNVPDMPDPGDGSVTYYYSNQQSARLMFYHEHAWGITRLNPYVGVAAGYLITDQWEQDLITRGILPPFLDQIPLIIQDKTFVNADVTAHPSGGGKVMTTRETDPLWNWGSSPLVEGIRAPITGDLWMPHVYMPAQTQVAGSGGANPFGRWMYGPWFYPATVIQHGPVDNPYYDADCSSPFENVYANCTTPGQPTQIPGTPNISMGMEAFQDTAVVNGTAFPSLSVEPRAYRFRILNAANDRFMNLSIYKADPNQVSPDLRAKSRLTEVKMTEASASLAIANHWPALWPVDGRDGGVPDPGTCTTTNGKTSCSNFGPKFLQIGTESGFLPKPVEIDHQPITYNIDPTAFWVGNVNKMGLALGPAERADVIVDFSQFAGQTLILYNDAPAAWPAGVASYDYYTGAPDMRDAGGYGTGGTWDPASGSYLGGTGSLVGYGPNTRTVMQIVVKPTLPANAYSFSRANLEKEFTGSAPATAINPVAVQKPGKPARTKTLFERSQDPIIVGQAAYKSAYPDSYFPPNFPWEGIAQINDQALKFVTVAGEPVIKATEPKGLHDEMGASFDPVYGRMSGNLGMQLPNPTTLNALLVLYGYSDVPTEFVKDSDNVNVQVIPNALTGFNDIADGTQIWKISHNGVDTHPIHFHIFDVQLINRVGWDGQILLPEPNELGWKETIKISPLEDTIIAVRPRAPVLPFGIPKSIRPLNPAIPIDSVMGFTGQPAGSNWPIPGSTTGSGFSNIDWTTGNAYVGINNTTPGTGFPYDNYKGVVTNVMYDYGWEYVWHCHILSHEEMDMMRPIVLSVNTAIPVAPVLTATAGGLLTWTDATPASITVKQPANEIGFRIERAEGAGAFDTNFAKALANATSFTDTSIAPVTNYSYRVVAYNATGETASNIVSILTLPQPAVLNSPANGSTLAGTTQTFTWNDVGALFYQLRVGSTVGGSEYGLFVAGPGQTSITVDGLPTGSLPLIVSLWSNVNGTWLSSSANYISAPTPVAVIASPSAGSILGTSQTFTWNDVGALFYQLRVGSTVGGSEYGLFVAAPGQTSLNVSGLPTGSLPLEVSLWSNMNGTWFSTNTNYISAPTPFTGATLSAPLAGATLGTSQTFTWNDVGALFYQLRVGSTVGGSEYGLFVAGPGQTSITVNGLPTGSLPLIVSLWSNVNGTWVSSSVNYSSAPTPGAVMNSPSAGSILGTSQTFTWNDVGALFYQLRVGSTVGGSEYGLYVAGSGQTSIDVSGLPTGSLPLQVSLWSNMNGTWVSSNTNYISAPTPVTGATLSFPLAGATLGTSQTFTWNDVGALFYQLRVGSTVGGSEYGLFVAAPGQTSIDVSGLPTGSLPLQVSLWSNMNGKWVFANINATSAP